MKTAHRGPRKAVLELTDGEREQLLRWARRPKTAQALALRSRIVLACTDGASNLEVARRLGVSAATVGKWRRRFVTSRLDGLTDEPRPGRPRTVDDLRVEEVIVKTLESPPPPLAHGGRRDPESAGHFQIGGTVRALQDDARAQGQG